MKKTKIKWEKYLFMYEMITQNCKWEAYSIILIEIYDYESSSV